MASVTCHVFVPWQCQQSESGVPMIHIPRNERRNLPQFDAGPITPSTSAQNEVDWMLVIRPDGPYLQLIATCPWFTHLSLIHCRSRYMYHTCIWSAEQISHTNVHIVPAHTRPLTASYIASNTQKWLNSSCWSCCQMADQLCNNLLTAKKLILRNEILLEILIMSYFQWWFTSCVNMAKA